jgi:hypothetical protein
MTEISFPSTLLYSWNSSSAVEDVSRILAQLSRTSPTSTKWEIETVLKIPKNQKLGPSLSKGALAASLIGTYFVNLHDIRVKCIIPKSLEGKITSDVDGSIEESKTRDESLVLRSSWIASGQRFHIGNCIISVGFIAHAGSAPKPCMELIYVRDDIRDQDEEVAGAVVETLHTIASDLLFSNEILLESLVSSLLIDSVEKRAMQWLLAMIK